MSPNIRRTIFGAAPPQNKHPDSAFRLLSILLAAVPALALTDDWLVQDVSAIAAASLLLFAIGAPQDDLKITVRLLRQLRLSILFPIAWMVLQIAPPRCRLCDQTKACDENDRTRHSRVCTIQVGCW
jgi:hypothetical protein